MDALNFIDFLIFISTVLKKKRILHNIYR